MSPAVKVTVWCIDRLIVAARWTDRLIVAFLGSGVWLHDRIVVWTARPRTYVGRWWHYSFKEPLTSPQEARHALRQMASYRIGTGSHRIALIRPGVRRFRFGVLVTVQQGKPRSWTQQWVRWIDDPMELWLLRSAVQAQSPQAGRTASPPPQPTGPSLLEGDIDSILDITR